MNNRGNALHALGGVTHDVIHLQLERHLAVSLWKAKNKIVFSAVIIKILLLIKFLLNLFCSGLYD